MSQASTLFPATVSHTSLTSTATSSSGTFYASRDSVLHNGQFGGQVTQNIIFGVLAVVLAFAALIIGWLQLRSFRHRADEEDIADKGGNYELVET